MKSLTMPDNGWTEEDKAIACNALWSGKYDHIIDAMRVDDIETVASSGERTAIPMRNYNSEAGKGDE